MTMKGVDYLIGKGVTDSAEDELSLRLNNLGLTKHEEYNPHNQYVDTFWRTGVIGSDIPLLIPLYGIFYGIKNKDSSIGTVFCLYVGHYVFGIYFWKS